MWSILCQFFLNFSSFQPGVAFHKGTSHSFYYAKQMTGPIRNAALGWNGLTAAIAEKTGKPWNQGHH